MAKPTRIARARPALHAAWRTLLLGLLVGCATGGPQPPELLSGARARGALTFVTPAEGSVVGDEAGVAWVLQSGGIPAPVVLEASMAGEPFTPLPVEPGPDRGPLSHTFVYSPSDWPPGSVSLRARYADDETGPSVTVMVGVPPTVVCTASAGDTPVAEQPAEEATKVAVVLDCSESTAAEGEIVSFEAELGDGATARFGAHGVTEHLYAPGKYVLSVTATTVQGLAGVFRGSLEIGGGLVTMAPPPPICGCERMEVHLLGQSQLQAPRPGQGLVPVQLGPDTRYAVYYFEIEAQLRDGSAPESCMEGQEVKRTSRTNLGVSNKGVCTAGLAGRECSRKRDCDDRVCRGGAADGKDCNSRQAFRNCVDGNGRCRIRTAGVCKTFPFAGNARTDDDYHLGSKDAPKSHRNDRVIWLDGPGEYGLARYLDFVSDADFLAYVRGGGGPSCSCHLRLHIEGDPRTGRAKPSSTLRVLFDGESERCVIGPV